MKKIFIAVLFLFMCSLIYAQLYNIDSLKQQLAASKEDTNKVWTLGSLSESYTFSFADTALLYAQQELKLSQQLNFEIGEAWGMNDLATALTTIGNYAKALDHNYKSLALFKKLNDTFGLSVAYTALGLCYREQGDYKKSIQNFLEALRLGKLWHNNYAIEIAEIHLSAVYVRANQLDSALFYAEKAYTVLKDYSALLTTLGAIHSKLGHNELALEFYKKAIPSAIWANAQTDILDTYNGIAHVYLNEGKTDSAIYFAKQALLQKSGKAYPIGMLNASTLLADIYESKNINDSALKYLKITVNLKDSLFNQQKTREAQSFAFNEQLQQQELEAQQQQNKSTLKMYALLAAVFIFLVVGFFLYRNNRHKQKAYALLQQKKQEIDIQKSKAETTLEELKSTQAQLIQSEKMASLGELTAGIAHEIQNPLNFVNNFSEVNNELIEELKGERSKVRGERNEVEDEILNDIKQNTEKILHHGKRADAIVKNMLQHSKQTKSIKEPTDINKLTDEYLRLSYHGLRAKDKSFNATLQTDFDKDLSSVEGKINIVPQDIGRVLLNLYNNAFYAVSERRKVKGEGLPAGQAGYAPTVSVCTKRINSPLGDGGIEIRVADNGPGIPQNIVDKIFQPFFTTKPTGQGTGLGLSLSYDIVKAHGGEIKVESKEGEGSEFIIQLPITVI